MILRTYVNFRGGCAEAFRFYEEHLGAEIGMMVPWEEAPGPPPGEPGPDWSGAIMHGRISIGDTELMGGDVPNAEPMRSAYLSLSVGSDAEAERIFASLAAGGEVFMPMEETFFATRFGQLRDRFGVNWMILHERPQPRGSAS